MLSLIQAIREAAKKVHVVYASSGGAVYGRIAKGSPIPETAPPEPTTSYGVQKLAGEHYLRLGAEEGWLTANALRIGNAYGVALPRERLQGFLGVSVAAHARGDPIRVFGDPENVRDYVHLDDICDAIDLALGRRDGYGVYNIGSGRGASVRELISLLEEASGRAANVEVEYIGGAAALTPWVVLDATKAARELGWKPKVLLDNGVRRLWEEVTLQ
jgi:UDP-glucose 4-epimerase